MCSACTRWWPRSLPSASPRRRICASWSRRIVEEYAGAQHAHRVLTEDVRFLDEADRERILGKEREVVAGFARAVAALRPELKRAKLAKPMTMLLFGMINWMFTWLKPDGELDHTAIAPMVADLFLGGLPAVKAPRKSAATVAVIVRGDSVLRGVRAES